MKEAIPRPQHQDARLSSWNRKFYLADVESILDPLVVVPDVGGSQRREYFLMKSRSEWVEIFKQWLDDPHELDRIPLTQPVPDHNILHV